MQLLQSLLPLLLLAACAAGNFIDDATKALKDTSVDLKVGGSGGKIGVKSDDNAFYYVECGASFNADTGFGVGCERKWKPLFYGCVAGGGVLAALLLSCCCCCCCAPCRKKRAAAYYPVMNQTSSVILVTSEAPIPVSNPPPPPAYDVPMLRA